jgi:hypothetical protein
VLFAEYPFAKFEAGENTFVVVEYTNPNGNTSTEKKSSGAL